MEEKHQVANADTGTAGGSATGVAPTHEKAASEAVPVQAKGGIVNPAAATNTSAPAAAVKGAVTTATTVQKSSTVAQKAPVAGVKPPAAAPAAPPMAAAPAFHIQNAVAKVRWIKGMVYGDYGVGKTFFTATAAEVPDMNDVLMVSAESGDMTVDDVPNLDIIVINQYKQIARIYEFLRLHVQLRNRGDIENLIKLETRFRKLGPDAPPILVPKQYKTVIIDSLTEIQKYVMYQLLGITVGAQALDLEPDSPQFAEWGKSAEMIRLLVRTFRDLDMNVLFVAAMTKEQDERKRWCHQPALPGKLANEVQGFLDFVGFYVAGAASEGGEMQRRLFLTPGQTYQAKNRFKRWNGTFLDNPTMADILRLQNTR